MSRFSKRELERALESMGPVSSADPSDAEAERLREAWSQSIDTIGGPDAVGDVSADLFARHGIAGELVATKDGDLSVGIDGLDDLRDPRDLDRGVSPEEFVTALAEDVMCAIVSGSGEVALGNTSDDERAREIVQSHFAAARDRRADHDHPEPWDAAGDPERGAAP